VSESTKDDLVARGLNAEQIKVIPNGIDLDWYTPREDVERAVRPTLLFLGRLKKYKRVDLVIEAVARLAESGTDVELVVGGSGDQLEELTSLVDGLGVSDRVRFAGFVSEEEKLRLLRTSWIHVLTSSKEGWGMSNLEAAACGTPTVASDSPGLRESVRDGETGCLVPHGDVVALTAALADLIANPETRGEMGRAARRFAEGFSWDSSAEAFESVLNRVVADSPTR